MLKYAIVLLNALGLFVAGTLFEDGVIIEDNTPTTLAPGEERMVEISINKGDVTGFAKLQIELPDGLTAEANDTHGASFTFSEQKVKFIWMALPPEQVFTVSYKLKASPSAKGNKIVNGVFSYIKSNQRVDYELQSKMIEINASAATSVAEDTGDFRCERVVTDLGNGDFLVRVNVKNATNEGFVKIRESLPSGFTATENENAGAVVTLDNGALRFVWFDAPRTKNYSVSYRLSGGMGDPNISGNLSYVSDNAPRELAIVQDGPVIRGTSPDPVVDVPSIDLDSVQRAREKFDRDEAERLAAIEAQRALESQANRERELKLERERQALEAQAAAERAKAEREAETSAQAAASSSIPDPENGVSYKVQIMAAHRVVDRTYFKNRHGFDENFGIENHEGWVKYTTGLHEAYKGARDDRERIRNRYNFNGPFVTAYNNGERITVQEALMITRQKWYK
jgi:hypothetical protein